MVSPDEVALAQIGKVVRVLSLEGEVVVADPIALARKIITGLSRHKCKKVQDRLETLSYTVF